MEIEVQRVAGTPFRVLARTFDLDKDGLCRHFKNHVTAKRKAELMAGPAAIDDLVNAAAQESRSALDFLKITHSVLFRQFIAAAEANDRKGVIDTASPMLEALRTVAKMTGELRALAGVTINNNSLTFVGSPEFAALSAGLLQIARAHPDAKQDIISLLRRLDEPGSPASGLAASSGLDAPRANGTAVHGLPVPRGAPVIIEGEAAQ